MNHSPLRAVLAIGLLAAMNGAGAESIFPVSNQGALARGFALPELGNADITAPGRNEWRLALDWTNEYFVQQTPAESLTLDGETQRYAVTWRRGIAPDFEVNAQLPLLLTGGGVLDGPMENWHSFWGLPNGGREAAPHGRYLYQYTRNGRSVLDVDTSTAGIGDIELGGGWQATTRLALRAMAKLPTGNAGKLLGGNSGGALWLDYDPFAGSGRWIGFLSAGASVNAEGEVLADQQQQLVGFAGAGAGFRLFRPFLLMAQIYGHSQLYHGSSTEALRREALQIAFGGRYEFTPRTALNLGFQEDLVTSSSPDFSIHLDLRFR
jgi:hypothetical protein